MNGRTSVSASPAPSSVRKGIYKPDKHRKVHTSIEHRQSNGEQNGSTPKAEARSRMGNGQVKSEDSHEHQSQHHRQPSSDNSAAGHKPETEAAHLLNALLHPIQDSLSKIRGATKELLRRTERAKVLRDELLKIGDFVQNVTRSAEARSERKKLDDDCW